MPISSFHFTITDTQFFSSQQKYRNPTVFSLMMQSAKLVTLQKILQWSQNQSKEMLKRNGISFYIKNSDFSILKKVKDCILAMDMNYNQKCNWDKCKVL